MGSGGSDRTLGEIGEFGVIDRLTRGRSQSGDVALGPGDDAAVVLAADGRVLVSTDMLVEGRHFRLDWSTPHDVGRKAVAQNAADIEAMGGRVTAFVVGFGAPPETPTAQVSALADGMWDEAGRIGAVIVGGDLVSSPQWVERDPGRGSPSPASWDTLLLGMLCGTTVLIDSMTCGSATSYRNRLTGRVAWRPRPAPRR